MPQSPIRVAITGAAGRMGKTLIQTIAETPGLVLAGAFERPGFAQLGADAGELAGVGAAGVRITDDLSAAVDRFDTLVDFSVPAATLASLVQCRKSRRRMVIGTTGFDAAGRSAIEAAAREIPIVMSPNYSVGVNVCFKLVEIAARILGDAADVEVTEAHHRNKIDAPSGTALKLGEIVANALGRNLADCAVYDRHGVTGVRDRKAIGFHSIRAGDLVGDHTVAFAAAGECIEVTHRASSRANFANGAMRAIAWLADKPAGLYSMQDVLGL